MSNPKTSEHIIGKNSKYLFQIDAVEGLAIDLTRFNEDYYYKVFAYAQAEKNTQAFVKKVLIIVKDTLIKQRQYDLNLKVNVKNRIKMETKNYYIHPALK
ncbi:MAG: hypothetical protein JWR38_1973 [Mucilaginibacter sp.]|nr:hypothetical protein [Mucilaginibacter sp.]